jgi:hypothetical protein
MKPKESPGAAATATGAENNSGNTNVGDPNVGGVLKLAQSQRAAARAALDALKPSDSDEKIAAVVAAALLAIHPGDFHLSISGIGPTRRRAAYPLPLTYDWHYKSGIGISTSNPKRAARWALDALLCGYTVSRHWREAHWRTGKGSIANARKWLLEEMSGDGKALH